MVNINIQEVQGTDLPEVLELLHKVCKENEELKKTIEEKFDELNKKVDDLSNNRTIIARNNTSKDTKDILIKALDGLKQVEIKPKKTVSENNVKDNKSKNTPAYKARSNNKTGKSRARYNLNDLFVVKNQGKEFYNKIIITPMGKLNHRDSRGRDWPLPFTINDVNYIDYLLKHEFTFKQFNDLAKKHEWNPVTLNKLIYNIQENKTFQNLIARYNGNIKKVNFQYHNPYIMISGKKTDILLKEAYDWVNSAINSNKNIHEIISQLQNNFDTVNPMHIYVIVYNYNNDSLNKLFKKHIIPKNTDFIENNPSKRKNLIRNSAYI